MATVQAYLCKSEGSLPVKLNYVVKRAAFETSLRGDREVDYKLRVYFVVHFLWYIM